MRTTVEHGNGTARASAPERRHRNARGEGARLADEIVAGAQALIERAGTDEAVTLRAVAREVGIAAPSIYAHFADREAIVLAVVARVFEELRVAVEAGITGAPDDPRERLVAGCLAYVEFGLTNPARYRILFSPERADDMCAEDHLDVDHSGRPILELGGESFDLLLDAVEACARIERTGQIDVVADATAVWATLHGLVSLETALPGFPWPDAEAFVRRSVLRVIGVEAGAGR